MDRKVIKNEENYTFKEPQIPYGTLFTSKRAALSLQGDYHRL
jgi:hypothetical protein